MPAGRLVVDEHEPAASGVDPSGEAPWSAPCTPIASRVAVTPGIA